VHCHALFWLRSLKAAMPQHIFCTTYPEHNLEMKALAKVHQKSHQPHRDLDYKTGAAASCPRSAEAEADHMRVFMPDVLGALRCHTDVLFGLRRGLLLKYVGGYVPKYSDSFQREWLEGEPSAWSLAHRVLNSFHPLEPQMWMTLSRMPMVKHSGLGKCVYIPDPDEQAECSSLTAYRQCRMRPHSMTWYTWLHCFRCHGSVGKPMQWLRRRHQREGRGCELNEWLAALQLQGEVCVALKMHSWLNDKAYGQWCLLHVAHRHVEELRDEDGARSFPEGVKHFATALRLRPLFWRDTVSVRNMLEAEGHRDYFVQSILHQVQANIDMVDLASAQLLAGLRAPAAQAGGAEIPQLTAWQRMQCRRVLELVRLSIESWSDADSTSCAHDRCVAWLLSQAVHRRLRCAGARGTCV
jgi:hypothetical protein